MKNKKKLEKRKSKRKEKQKAYREEQANKRFLPFFDEDEDDDDEEYFSAPNLDLFDTENDDDYDDDEDDDDYDEFYSEDISVYFDEDNPKDIDLLEISDRFTYNRLNKIFSECEKFYIIDKDRTLKSIVDSDCEWIYLFLTKNDIIPENFRKNIDEILDKIEDGDIPTLELLAICLLAMLGEKNLFDAMLILKKAMDLGSIRAQTMIGVFYLSGEYNEIPRNYERGIKLIEDAAEKNYDVALLLLGLIYEKGLDAMAFCGDSEKAMSCFQKAFDLTKNPYASCILADALLKKPKRTKEEEKKIVELFSNAALGGEEGLDVSYACVKMGLLFGSGTFIEKDMEKAYLCFKKANELTVSKLSNFLIGLMSLTGQGCPVDYQKAQSCFDDVTCQSSLNYYIQGVIAEIGDTLFEDYIKSSGLSEEDAFESYTYAENSFKGEEDTSDNAQDYVLGDDLARLALARMFLLGIGTKKNYAQAYHFLQALVLRKNKYAYWFLGYMYEKGFYVEKDEDKAEFYFSIASDLGVSNKQMLLYIQNTKRMRKDDNKQFLTTILRYDDLVNFKFATYLLYADINPLYKAYDSMKFEKIQRGIARKFYEYCRENSGEDDYDVIDGFKEMQRITMLFCEVSSYTNSDINASIEDLELFMKLGVLAGYFLYANILFKQIQEKYDPAVEKEMFEKYSYASSRNYYPAMLAIAKCYCLGIATKPNFEEACKLIDNPYHRDRPEALTLIGHFLRRGIFLTLDPAQALRNYKKAVEVAESHHKVKYAAEALYFIAYHYLYGISVDVDIDKANEYFLKAIRSTGIHFKGTDYTFICSAAKHLDTLQQSSPDDIEESLFLSLLFRFDESPIIQYILLNLLKAASKGEKILSDLLTTCLYTMYPVLPSFFLFLKRSLVNDLDDETLYATLERTILDLCEAKGLSEELVTSKPRSFKSLAKKDGFAALMYALQLLLGIHYTRDIAKAIEFLELSTKLGEPESLAFRAMLLYFGIGMEKDIPAFMNMAKECILKSFIRLDYTDILEFHRQYYDTIPLCFDAAYAKSIEKK